ncbi:MAG: DUF892 family protein [Dehalococcoidales bacterium]|nr:DUF892 family protein [Dehalococcoidales bacterium]
MSESVVRGQPNPRSDDYLPSGKRRDLLMSAMLAQQKDALQRHESTVNTQISHLQDCIRKVGGQETSVENYVIKGVLKEVDEFRRQNPPVEAFDLICTARGVLIRFGCLKSAGYRLLTRQAQALGEQDCVRTLDRDLSLPFQQAAQPRCSPRVVLGGRQVRRSASSGT